MRRVPLYCKKHPKRERRLVLTSEDEESFVHADGYQTRAKDFVVRYSLHTTGTSDMTGKGTHLCMLLESEETNDQFVFHLIVVVQPRSQGLSWERGWW